MGKKIFLLAPANYTTGGVELLHQLTSIINGNGGDASIVYLQDGEPCNAPVPDEYRDYQVKVASDVEDDTYSMVIVPEVFVNLIPRFHKAKVIIWWLSVDNFFIANQTRLSLFDLYRFDKKIFWAILRWRTKRSRRKRLMVPITLSIRKIRKSKQVFMHLYQSEYAKIFLEKNSFHNIHELSDFIHTKYNDELGREKINAIAYNPKKGIEFTEQLKAMAPDLQWLPIEGLTREGVIELLSRCKVYIDFGNHPGKDRIPREAALCKCIVITGMRGAAKYFEDVPIPQKYKINEKRKSACSDAIALIKDALENYDSCIGDFEPYRNSIASEKSKFISQAVELFCK